MALTSTIKTPLTRATFGNQSFGHHLRSFSSSPKASKQRVAILGSGWAGYEVLRRIDKKLYDVTMISPNTYFAFTPLLASTAVGTLEFRTALEPTRAYGDRVQAYQAWVDRIDFSTRTLECVPAVGSNVKEKSSSKDAELYQPFKLSYDKLVIAVGCYSQTFNIPGVKENAYFLKDVKDARKIRSRILECFELAGLPTLTDVQRQKLLHFVVVGGGPTGVEFSAELHDLISTDLARHYPSLAPLARITIYDTAKSILGAFDKELVDYAMEQFNRQGVQIKNNRHVTKLNSDSLEIKEEGVVPSGMTVWSTGLAPNPLIDSIKDLKRDEKTHSLEVDNHFRPFYRETGKICPDVYVLGDAAALKERLPATAQVAAQEAKHLAKYLNSQVRSWQQSEPREFQYSDQGIMTYIGNWRALVDRSHANSSLKGKESGRLAWLAWRSVYWGKSLSIRNKINLAYYWFFNWIFGRSITRF